MIRSHPVLQSLVRFLVVLVLASCFPFCNTQSTDGLHKKSDSAISRIAFGSCNKHDKPQPLWKPIIETKPQLWIWTGDIIYADTEDMKVIEQKYSAQKNNAGYKLLLSTCPVIGIWDDHDYGINNGGKDFPGKFESQQKLLTFLDEPKESPRRKQPGAYASYTYGTQGKKVKVLLLDVRFHRDPPGKDSEILGKEQWHWLEQELKNSTAQIHLIISGSQIIPEEHPYEKWVNYPKCRDRLFTLIGKHDIKGVIFISGDRHIAEISKIENSAAGYPLYEITSSGLTHSWDSFPGEKNSHRVGNYFQYLNFGLIEIDWNGSPVSLSLQIRDKNNAVQIMEKILLPQLSADK